MRYYYMDSTNIVTRGLCKINDYRVLYRFSKKGNWIKVIQFESDSYVESLKYCEITKKEAEGYKLIQELEK